VSGLFFIACPGDESAKNNPLLAVIVQLDMPWRCPSIVHLAPILAPSVRRLPEVEIISKSMLDGRTEGNLIITDNWPSQMKNVYGDHKHFI